MQAIQQENKHCVAQVLHLVTVSLKFKNE